MYALAIHGGAGAIADTTAYEESLARITAAGERLLADGADALAAVEHCVSLLEDDSLYNAGKGSVLDAKGGVVCDAGIMRGSDMEAGAIAGVHGIRNPIQLARTVMEHSQHVFLVGEGAETFACDHEVPQEPDSYFKTQKRIEQLQRAQQQNEVALDHNEDDTEYTDKKYGTVGAVARDAAGNLAAATSTGGLVNKQYGRVGDSPVIGAGVYADNAACAVSTTGVGEHFLRTALAKTAADIAVYECADAQKTADRAAAQLTEKISGIGGLIVVDPGGSIGVAHTTPGILAAHVQAGGSITTLTTAQRAEA